MEGPCDAKDGTALGEDHQTAVNNVTYYGGDDGDTGENEGLVSEHEEDAEQDAVSKQLLCYSWFATVGGGIPSAEDAERRFQ